MKTKLINFFRKPFNLCSLIGVTAGLILSLCYFSAIGTFNPPTEADFYEMHKKEKLIMENFDNVYSLNNTTVYINNQEIIVTIVSEEESCFLVEMTFSKGREFISSKEISNKPGYQTEANKVGDKFQLYLLVLIEGVVMGGFFTIVINDIYKRIKSF